MPTLNRIRFAAARPSEASAMRALAEAAYRYYVPRIGKPPAPMTADYDAIAALPHVTLAWRDDELVGMLVLELRGEGRKSRTSRCHPRCRGAGSVASCCAGPRRMRARPAASSRASTRTSA